MGIFEAKACVLRQSKGRSRLWLVLIVLSSIVAVLSTSGYLLSMLPGHRPVLLGEWVGIADSRPITSDTPHPTHGSGNAVVRVSIRRKILSLVPRLKGEVEIADDRGNSQRFTMHTFATPPPVGDWTLSAALDAKHQETHLFAARLSPHDSLWVWTRGIDVETVGMLQRGEEATYRELVGKLSTSH